MVRQEFVMLADAAEAVGGKIYILGGGTERHLAPGFPTMLRADIALGLLVGWGDTNNRHRFSVKFVDEDGGTTLSVDGEFEAGRPAGAKFGQDLRQLIAIRGPFPIPQAGAYKVVLTLDDEEQQPAFRFWVDETAAPVTPAGGIG